MWAHADRVLEDRLLPCCSPAETLISSSLQDRDLTQHLYCCSVTLLMSRHQLWQVCHVWEDASCRRNRSKTGHLRGIPKSRAWNKPHCCSDTMLNEFIMNDQDVLAFFCNGYVIALISANPPFFWRVPSALLFDWSIHLTSVNLFSWPISNSGSLGEVESIPADGTPRTGGRSQG